MAFGKEGFEGFQSCMKRWGREDVCVMDVFAVLMKFCLDMSEFTELCSLLHVRYGSTLKSSMFIHSL